jgi:hypothetical protein
MIEVIGKDTSIAKTTVCRNCASVLRYLPMDVRKEYKTDYTGGRDYYDFIQCPCGKLVTVK